MLSKKVFDECTKKLVIEFGDKGFSMKKERAIQWYEHLKNYTDSDFQEAISYCLENCEHCPSMASVFKRARESVNQYRRLDVE